MSKKMGKWWKHNPRLRAVRISTIDDYAIVDDKTVVALIAEYRLNDRLYVLEMPKIDRWFTAQLEVTKSHGGNFAFTKIWGREFGKDVEYVVFDPDGEYVGATFSSTEDGYSFWQMGREIRIPGPLLPAKIKEYDIWRRATLVYGAPITLR